MPANIRECANLAVIAANDDNAFTQIFERPPFAGLCYLAFMANHLRRCAQECLLLRLEELGVVVEPTGQAHAVERIGSRLDRLQVCCHQPGFATGDPRTAIRGLSTNQWRGNWA